LRDLIVLVAAYVLLVVEFRLFGGIGAAGDALRRWGRASSSDERVVSSST
jgi:hypothetical protein